MEADRLHKLADLLENHTHRYSLATVACFRDRLTAETSPARILAMMAEVLDVKNHIAERLKQHKDNLDLWESGFLNPTEPDEFERAAVKRELRAAIAELEAIQKML